MRSIGSRKLQEKREKEHEKKKREGGKLVRYVDLNFFENILKILYICTQLKQTLFTAGKYYQKKKRKEKECYSET